MIVSKTRNAPGWATKEDNLIPNGVKCNKKRNFGISSKTSASPEHWQFKNNNFTYENFYENIK